MEGLQTGKEGLKHSALIFAVLQAALQTGGEDWNQEVTIKHPDAHQYARLITQPFGKQWHKNA